MKTELSPEFANTPRGELVRDIVRNCVHCGMCNATCPTYQLLGDELDGPRGRIYQIKQVFEGDGNPGIRLHLDRCLLCRACETTCPSGVRYGALLETGRAVLDEAYPRRKIAQTLRRLLARVLVSQRIFTLLVKIAQRSRFMLPRKLVVKIPAPTAPNPAQKLPAVPTKPRSSADRRMVILGGCVQSVLTAQTNRAAARVLERFGISVYEAPGAGCCGGVALHTCGEADGRTTVRKLIDAWLPQLERGAESLLITASGCGVTVKDYPRLFADEPAYRDKAARIAAHSVDIAEVVAREMPENYAPQHNPTGRRVAFHAPCTLQHGQRLGGTVEAILQRVGYQLCEVADSHLCCGSAGTYSILQPRLATQLRHNKQAALFADSPEVVATANVGCQLHLSQGAKTPVVHWIELLV